VVVGDGSVGKTCLCTVYAKNEFPTEYVPTIFETFTMTMVLSDNKELKVNIWDTAGQEEFEHLRTLNYSQTDLFIICFNLVNRCSFDNVKSVWLKDLKEMAPGVPKFLVGTMKDLQGQKEDIISKIVGQSGNLNPPSNNEISRIVKQHGLIGYKKVRFKNIPYVLLGFGGLRKITLNNMCQGRH